MRSLRVLMSYRGPNEQSNPFVHHLTDGLKADGVEVSHLELTSFARSFDVLHVHWPENLFTGSSQFKTVVKLVAGLLLLLRVTVGRKPVIYTKHNLEPHDGGALIFRRLYKYLEEIAIVHVYLNESPENDPGRGVTILHGDYPRPANAPDRSPSSERFELLFFGQIRRYKNLEGLLGAFRGCQVPGIRLKIRGGCKDRLYQAELEELVAGDPRVEFLPGFVSDEELESDLARANAVILPYAKIYNSGAALLALSRSVPVLAPDGPATRSLQNEVGVGHVQLFRLPLDATDLTQLAESSTPSGAPNLSRRDWGAICSLYHRLYVTVRRVRGTSERGKSTSTVRTLVAADEAFISHSAGNRLAS